MRAQQAEVSLPSSASASRLRSSAAALRSTRSRPTWQAASGVLESPRPTNGAASGGSVITICDTGPLVAYLNRNDPYHAWALGLMKQMRPPMRTCEAALTEVVYFLAPYTDSDGTVRSERLVCLGNRSPARVAQSLSSSP